MPNYEDEIPDYDKRRSMGLSGLLDVSLDDYISDIKKTWKQQERDYNYLIRNHKVKSNAQYDFWNAMFVADDNDKIKDINDIFISHEKHWHDHDGVTFAFNLLSNAYINEYGSYYKKKTSMNP